MSTFGSGSSRARVYPRVGGGTWLFYASYAWCYGLSPRGRGNPSYLPFPATISGSIPAWAGEPAARRPRNSPRWVYPRVGGGTFPNLRAALNLGGLSPRGRGNQRLLRAPWGWAGSIPAWAGEPATPTRTVGMGRVYPRVGGGTQAPIVQGLRQLGLSPRGRGERRGIALASHQRGKIARGHAAEPRRLGLRHVEQAEQPRHGAAVELHPGARGAVALLHSEYSSPAGPPCPGGRSPGF